MCSTTKACIAKASLGAALLIGSLLFPAFAWATTFTTYEWVAGAYTYDAALVGASSQTLNGVTGHLLTFESAAESQVVTNWLHANYDTFPDYYATWLGISDAVTEGSWLYTAGPLAASAITFVNWLPGEPNNVGNEDYADFNFNDPTGRWTDRSATNLFAIDGYVVEFDGLSNDPGLLPDTLTVGTPEPSTLALFGFGIIGIAGIRSFRATRAAG